jgi:hypothetical protein
MQPGRYYATDRDREGGTVSKKLDVTVTNSGAFRVNPADIFRSDVAKAIIKKTHETVRIARQQPPKPSKNSR